MDKKWLLLVALVLGLAAAVVVAPGIQIAGGPVERLQNGDFEAGFYSTPAGLVATGWHWFHNAGQAVYGFYDETWRPVIQDGEHGQLIEINTFSTGGADPDRYAGIYQTVSVMAGESYDLSLYGMLRALEDDPDRAGFNYRIQYGIDYDGGTDWQGVANWVELPWDTVHPRRSPGSMSAYTTTLTATGPRLTLFVRGWKKWGTVRRELDVNLDAISLRGGMPAGGAGGATVTLIAPAFPMVGEQAVVAVSSSGGVGLTGMELTVDDEVVGTLSYDVGLLDLDHDFAWVPTVPGTATLKVTITDAAGGTASDQATVTVGESAEFLSNGSFEGGFQATPRGKVGLGWGWFENNGQAAYGFYDETWQPVIYDGGHSQLIEINTYGRAGSNPDRYAGIYQVVDGLTVGASYELALHGMARALATDEDLDGYNYRLEWGLDPAGATDWQAVAEWVEIPWDEVYSRLSPGPMKDYAVTFQAPSPQVTLFVRAWKKWATTGRELDINVDAISLTGYK